MTRVLVGTPAVLGASFFVGEEQEGAGSVTVTVTRADGTAIATNAATTASGESYLYALDPQDRLDLLKLVWTGSFGGKSAAIITECEIVGGFHVGLDEIRGQPNVGNTAKWEQADIEEARDWWEDLAEEYTGVAWVPRYARERVSVSRQGTVILDHYPVRSVISVRSYTSPTAFSTFTEDELADLDVSDSGVVCRQWLGAWPADHLWVEYEHGFPNPPADLRAAGLVAIRDKLLGDKTGTRQLSVATEQGIVRSATASKDFPVGIPFVDAALNRHRKHRVPSVA